MAEDLPSWLLDRDMSMPLSVINKVGKHLRVCWLCGTGVFSSNHTQEHKSGKQHQNRWMALRNMKAQKCWQDKSVSPAILLSAETITHAAWKYHVKSILFDSVVMGQDVQTSPTHEKVLSLLHRYHYMEKLSLLELAIWKAKLESENQSNHMIDRDYCRKHCGSQVIIPLVMKFIPEGSHRDVRGRIFFSPIQWTDGFGENIL